MITRQKSKDSSVPLKNKNNLTSICSKDIKQSQKTVVQNNKKPPTSNTEEGNKPDLYTKSELVQKTDGCVQTDIDFKTILMINELLGKNWLTDEVLNDYFNLLNSKILLEGSCLILNPLIVQAIKCNEDVNIFLDPINIKVRDYLIIPINDSAVSLTVGGSHWSVLVYQRKLNEFYHYDSLGQYNLSSAKNVANIILKYLKGEDETL